MASASGREGQPVHSGKVTSWLSKLFELNPAGLHWPRAVLFLDVALVPLVLFWAIGHQEYLLSALFGAGVTALGFGIGGDAWGWLVLAAFAVTLTCGLAIAFGVRRFATAELLNVWFIIALALANGFHHQTHFSSYTWAQTLAWTGGRRCGSR
jgi:hypothetical protein